MALHVQIMSSVTYIRWASDLKPLSGETFILYCGVTFLVIYKCLGILNNGS